MRCDDCATDCPDEATVVVRDELEPQGEWRYCDKHAPRNDSGVEVTDE